MADTRIVTYPEQNGKCTSVVEERVSNDWVLTDICESNEKSIYSFIFAKAECIMRGMWAEMGDDPQGQR